jgi:hypothetical protein
MKHSRIWTAIVVALVVVAAFAQQLILEPAVFNLKGEHIQTSWGYILLTVWASTRENCYPR